MVNPPTILLIRTNRCIGRALYIEGRLLSGAVRIVNVVATASLDHPVDLESLSCLFPHIVIYDPEVYPPPAPAYFKSKGMQGKVSIFPSGKMISVGTDSEEKAKHELMLVADRLRWAKLAEMKTAPKIENIVATADLGFKPDLEKMSITAEPKVVYEPERFPGAIIRLSIPKDAIQATVLLFASGKMVCVGLKKSEDVHAVIQKLLYAIAQS